MVDDRAGAALDAIDNVVNQANVARDPELLATVYADPLRPDEALLPVDPSSDVPTGFTEDQRGVPGGFVADPDDDGRDGYPTD